MDHFSRTFLFIIFLFLYMPVNVSASARTEAPLRIGLEFQEADYNTSFHLLNENLKHLKKLANVDLSALTEPILAHPRNSPFTILNICFHRM